MIEIIEMKDVEETEVNLMNKSKELMTTTEIVKDLLTRIPATRNNDDYLYYKVCERLNKKSCGLPFNMVIMNRKEYGFPGFETVRRSRQKLQQHFPELAGCDVVEAHRNVNEEVFRDFARKVGI